MKGRNRTSGIFIYVVHRRSANKETKGKWDVFEEVYVKNGKKDRLMTESSIVLDCNTMSVYKNRHNNSTDFYEILTYLAKNHKQVAEFKEYYDTFNKQMEKYLGELNKVSNVEDEDASSNVIDSNVE